jgi:hypothetical protein
VRVHDPDEALMALDDKIRRAVKQLFEVAGLAAETSFVEMVRGPG